MQTLKSALRVLAYQTGLLGLIHRIRNRNTLTVFMFHRVLPSDSTEYACAEREFTLSQMSFSQCIDFIDKHFNVVSSGSVNEFLNGRGSLPRRAALITFDDGWRDTVLYALPELRKRSLPALLFLATEVLDSSESRWWQDALVEAVTEQDGLELLETELRIIPDPTENRSSRVQHLTAKLAEKSENERLTILRAYIKHPIMNRQMLTRTDLADLRPLSIAGHGHSHIPLTELSNASADLLLSRQALQGIGGEVEVMSFPHGAVNDDVLEQAHRAGFETCYSSDPVLLDAPKPANRGKLIGRIHIPENQWTCGSNGISSAKLATFLFFRPIVR
jgi:peptidoglycan/xylan/chitin deacetylase (PgdA/CDA1 family)